MITHNQAWDLSVQRNADFLLLDQRNPLPVPNLASFDLDSDVRYALKLRLNPPINTE